MPTILNNLEAVPADNFSEEEIPFMKATAIGKLLL